MRPDPVILNIINILNVILNILNILNAYLSGHYTLEQVGEFFGVSYATVGRAVKKMESGGL